ncbi:Methyl-accepting transducer domain-containing protein OS=Lysinibacillus sphaericus OX=1421 GN=LS41612_21610 PE=3 SV=1 [Lysinibacillus sphaericus]
MVQIHLFPKPEFASEKMTSFVIIYLFIGFLLTILIHMNQNQFKKLQAYSEIAEADAKTKEEHKLHLERKSLLLLKALVKLTKKFNLV